MVTKIGRPLPLSGLQPTEGQTESKCHYSPILKTFTKTVHTFIVDILEEGMNKPKKKKPKQVTTPTVVVNSMCQLG